MLLLVCVHTLANLVWIGSIASVGVLLTHAGKEADPARARTVAELAVGIYRTLATPAFLASFVFGLGRLLVSADDYLHAHWFHGKLTFALAVIALHHVLGAKAKRAASRNVQPGSTGAILTAALLVSAFMAVVFVIYKTQLVR